MTYNMPYQSFQRGGCIVLDNGERGEVVGIGIRSARIQTRDDVMISIPNFIITNAKIVNQSSPEPMYRVRIRVGVAYGSDIQRVEEIGRLLHELNPGIYIAISHKGVEIPFPQQDVHIRRPPAGTMHSGGTKISASQKTKGSRLAPSFLLTHVLHGIKSATRFIYPFGR